VSHAWVGNQKVDCQQAVQAEKMSMSFSRSCAPCLPYEALFLLAPGLVVDAKLFNLVLLQRLSPSLEATIEPLSYRNVKEPRRQKFASGGASVLRFADAQNA
jgi:hypothetical protein